MIRTVHAEPVTWIFIALLPLVVCLPLMVWTWWCYLQSRERIISLLIFVIALFALWPSAYHAFNFKVSPDSVEYASGAFRLLTKGSYDVVLHNESYPPRYPLGFSLFVLLPGLLLTGFSHPGMAIFSVAILTALGAPASFLIARRLHTETSGFIAAAIFLLLPALAPFSQEILTPAPSASLWLLIFAVFLHAPRGFLPSTLIGLLIFYATACRPLSGMILAPILAGCHAYRRQWFETLVTIAPCAILGLGYLFYNAAIFGSPFRTGYHFWTSIPYDIFSLVFHPRYVFSNLLPLIRGGAPIFALIGFLGYPLVTGRPLRASPLRPALVAATILVVVHLLYFFPDTSFYLPAAALLTPLTAISLSVAMKERRSILAFARNCILLSLAATVVRVSLNMTSHSRNERIDYLLRVKELIPGGSVFISALNPAHVALVFGESSSTVIVPVSRRTEYASKVVALEKIPALEGAIRSAYDHRSRFAPTDSVSETFPYVATENPETIQEWLRVRQQVFLDTRFSHPNDLRLLQQRFSFIEVGPGLASLSPRHAHESP